MFDWNDEELTNIIWGKAGESDDHIVPYPGESEQKPPGLYEDGIKKELNQEGANTKPAEQKKPISKTNIHGGKLERNAQYDTNGGLSPAGFDKDSWPDLSLSITAKTDKDSMGTDLSNNLTEISKCDSSRCDETARLENGSEIFQNRNEDREQGDFVDYGWANIGSFDDLDRIFSNDDTLFGHVSLDNADELWSSSKDVTNTPEKSFPLSINSPNSGLGALRSTFEQFEIKTEYVLDQDQSFTPGYGKMNDPTSHPPQNVQASVDAIEYAGCKSKISVKGKTALEMVGNTPAFSSHLDTETVATPNEFVDKLFSCVQVNRQKKLLKGRKKADEKTEGRELQDLCSTWSPSGNQFQQFDGRFAPPMAQTCLSPVLSQQRQLQGPESLQYLHFSNPLLAPSVYRNMTNQYAAMLVLPQFHSGDNTHQPLLSGYEVSPGNANPLNKSPDAHVKPLSMTPQEKIEKLRRRQQMRAMLAIQKQQQQFSHQVPCTDHSMTHKCSHENQMQLMEGNIEFEENLSSLPSLEANSPIEQDDSNTICIAIDDCSVEDTILHRLQETIEKLDIRIRLCIRDSLFRLTQSAMQRHYASDTSSSNRSNRDELEVFMKEEINSHNRFARMPDVETQTNPIDRTVAHFLFHIPLDLPGKHPETPASTKNTCERKATGSISSPKGFLPESSKYKKILSHQGSKISCLSVEGDHSKNSPCIATSENASNNEPAGGGAMEIEASH
uniref:Protein LNK2 n=1 Tax=Davidia involucrata TaxID=16924 RepID=A0A5B6ZSQ3_DAVIN